MKLTFVNGAGMAIGLPLCILGIVKESVESIDSSKHAIHTNSPGDIPVTIDRSKIIRVMVISSPMQSSIPIRVQLLLSAL